MTREPHEIITDLLYYIRSGCATSPQIVNEASDYVAKVAEDKAAWERILNDPFFKNVDWPDPLARDEWREDRKSRRPNYDSGL